MANAQLQYNGLLLLYGYLQRLFVYKNVQHLLSQSADQPDTELQQQLDAVSKAMQDFDPKKGLTPKQTKEFSAVLETIRNSIYTTAETAENPEEPEKLAATAASVYADNYINTGLIHLGGLFNPKIEERFRQHIPHFKNRINRINHFVEKVSQKQKLAPKESDQLSALYNEITENKIHIDSDLRSIEFYLKGSKPPEIE